ncbi:hypothetical protein KZI27_01525 [Curtobacterium sp. TC1]|uniref:hypothetical protein n=1 Tax=Curtobacterium sp. TC1 TaxID=2862880 RepID=UPI001C9B5D7B|nr:hypothetical protein [Curtobacterium sp. TC1]QZQ55577.1 hypothetical protein KZI27_01525 [Curtobacterium sp. TC1]
MTRTAPPRLSLDELFLEVSLTNQKHLVVEGRTDERFLRAWLRAAADSHPVAVTPVENLEVDAFELASHGLSDGARGRVLIVALHAHEQGIDIRCVADRDTGSSVAAHSYDTLLWTDYPAIESYALHAETLDLANLLSFNEQLPSGAELVDSLTDPLRELFAIRSMHPNLQRPNYGAAFKGGGSLRQFDSSKVVPPEIQAVMSAYPRPEDADSRLFAYGHDIGELLLGAYGGKLKNKAGLANLGAVEAALRSALLLSGYIATEPLFLKLSVWVAT